MIEYTLNRYKRKSIGIYVKDGQVEVRAPLCCPQENIDAFVNLKTPWILERLAKHELRENFVATLNYGSKISLLGGEYTIAPIQGLSLEANHVYIPQNLPPTGIQPACINAFTHIARGYLPKRVAHFAPIMEVAPRSVTINSAKSRWGSCSQCKKLNFSWRLIMGAPRVIDYVVVHELAHIYEMNHGPNYWAVVEKFMPDYQERIVELKALGSRLNNEGW